MRLSLTLRQAKKRLKFVPNHIAPKAEDLKLLQEFVWKAQRLLVLTGAGLSTESGIPDYRSENVGLYATTDRRPMMYKEFVSSVKGRQRYWARNYVGWPQFASFQPNASHRCLADMEKQGRIHWLVTQNVDALHTKAGSKRLTELHGCTHRVICLSCPSVMKRWDLQKLFAEINPDFHERHTEIAPDGDVLLTEDQVENFKVPDCPSCGGILMPDVVFFGDNVAKSKVEQVFEKVAECDSMLVAGTSLQVYSAYRFMQRANALRKPIAMVNIGPTRADGMLALKIPARCGQVLPALIQPQQT